MNYQVELREKQSELSKSGKMNLRMLTEIRNGFETSRGLPSAFRIGHNKSSLFKRSNLLNVTSKKTMISFKSINRKIGCLTMSYNSSIELTRAEVIKREILKNLKGKINGIKSSLMMIFETGESINDNFYNYHEVQQKLRQINEQSKEIKSISLEFYSYCVSGFILFEYGNFSLTIYYLDKALKLLASKEKYPFERMPEMSIYNCVAKVFLQIFQIKDAKEMAYMYLRKTWHYNNADEEMNAYDLLGRIQLEEGNIEMSRYFHWRMCQGFKEEKDITHMSNQELDKREKDPIQFNVYEDIMIFVRKQKQIVGILMNHYRSEAEEEKKGFCTHRKNKQIFMYTHRSPNRVLRNHRSLERRLIDEKQSNEIHFVRPKDVKKLRRLITDFTSFIFDLIRKCETDSHLDENESRFSQISGL